LRKGRFLHDQAFKITGDGVFGPETEDVIKEFQQAQSLSVTGIVTPEVTGIIQEEASLPSVPEKNLPAVLLLKKAIAALL